MIRTQLIVAVISLSTCIGLSLACGRSLWGVPGAGGSGADAGGSMGRRAGLLFPVESVGEVLQGFMQREAIYCTDWFRQRLEARARCNLAQALGL